MLHIDINRINGRPRWQGAKRRECGRPYDLASIPAPRTRSSSAMLIAAACLCCGACTATLCAPWRAHGSAAHERNYIVIRYTRMLHTKFELPVVPSSFQALHNFIIVTHAVTYTSRLAVVPCMSTTDAGLLRSLAQHQVVHTGGPTLRAGPMTTCCC